MAFGMAFKIEVFLMAGKFWWRFSRLSSDGWSSGFESVELLLERLRGSTKSEASRNLYCYNLFMVCLWLTKQLRPSGEPSQLALTGSKFVKEHEKSKNKWVKLAAELNFEIVNPDQLIAMAKEDPDKISRLIRKLALEHFEAGSFRYANNIIATMNTFFEVNKVKLEIKCFSVRGRGRLRKRQEEVPSPAEALKMADVAGSLRNRLLILMLAYSALRNSTLRALVYNEEYPEPLYQEYTIKKQLEKGLNCLALVVHPIMKNRDPNACKNNEVYYTFIPPVVTELLSLYLKEIKEKYGSLKDNQPIFHTENRRLPLAQRLFTILSPRELQKIVKDAAKRVGIKNWKLVTPHSLRKTFEIFLRDQPEDVRLDVKDREFLMGHLLPGVQDTYYVKYKIEEMRQKYARMNFEPVMRVEKEERVVAEDELQSFLQQGWHFEATLPSSKVVVWRKAMITQTSTVTPQPILEKRENQSSTLQPMQENTKKEEKPSKSLESETETFKKEKESLTKDQSSLISHSSTPQKITLNNNNAHTTGFNIPGKTVKHKQTSILQYMK
jgi:integrase